MLIRDNHFQAARRQHKLAAQSSTEPAMSLQLGDIAPDFTLDSTAGTVRFHDYAGGHWVVFFSHPKDFTPVCTTELGAFASRKAEFDARRTKLIGLSVDTGADHHGWAKDVADVGGAEINYPPSAGRNVDEVLRVLDSLQLTDGRKLTTPVDWQPGDDVIIAPSVSDEDARKLYPDGWRTLKPYLRLVPAPAA